MDQVTKVRKHLKREQWKSLISYCQSSGMTVTAWCSLNGICEQTYYRNLKRLREEFCETLPIPVDTPEKPVTFKKLEISWQQFRWLMEGLEIEQKSVILPAEKAAFC